jgi:hypothetical protein
MQIEEKFDMDSLSKRLEELYLRLMHEPHAPPALRERP